MAQPKRLELEHSEGFVPLVSVEGTAHECGRQLGYTWREALLHAASEYGPNSTAWWTGKRYARVIDRYAPHLRDLYRGMARTTGLPEEQIGPRAPIDAGGCTSFAIAPEASLDGQTISGQTKDTATNRMFQFQVMRMKCTDAPSALSLTYAGWLFGHGFVQGGCAVFRNSLFTPSGGNGLPYDIFGLLSLYCPTVEHVVELARREGVSQTFHITVADSHGGIIGIESTDRGFGVLKPRRGIYVHANAVCTKRIARSEHDHPPFVRSDSIHRQERLGELLAANRGRLTAQLAFRALADHDGYPISICRHQNQNAFTTAAVVVEPTRSLLHCTRGQPCRNWPKTYSL